MQSSAKGGGTRSDVLDALPHAEVVADRGVVLALRLLDGGAHRGIRQAARLLLDPGQAHLAPLARGRKVAKARLHGYVAQRVAAPLLPPSVIASNEGRRGWGVVAVRGRLARAA